MLQPSGVYVVEFLETRTYRVPFEADSVEDATNKARQYITDAQPATDEQTRQIQDALIEIGSGTTYDNLGFSINRITPRYLKSTE